MSEDVLTRTLESVYRDGRPPVIFQTVAEPVVAGIFESLEYMEDQRNGQEFKFPVEDDRYNLSVNKSWGGGHPPGNTHNVVFGDKEIDAERTVEVYVKPDGEIFSFCDERRIKLDLPNGDRIEIKSSNHANKADRDRTKRLPEPKGTVSVLTAEELRETAKSFRHVLIFKKGGGLVSLVETEKGIYDEVAKQSASEQQRTLFEMSCQKFLGGVDLSLYNLLD